MTQGTAPRVVRQSASVVTAGRRHVLVLFIVLLAMAAGSQRADAQSGRHPRPPGSVTIGPVLLEYRMECVDSRTCRVQCFQHGTKIIDRGDIGKNDRLRMFASTSALNEIVPRWIEVRPSGGREVQSVLLSSSTTCDLKSLVILPNEPR